MEAAEKQRIRSRAYYLAHKAELNARSSAYYQAHKPARAEHNKEYCKTRKASVRLNSNLAATRCREGYKESAINMYSNGEQCCATPGCGQCDIDVLCLDHIADNGAAHRIELGRAGGGEHLYKWLRDRDYPVGFQVLCANCNLKKEILRRRALWEDRQAKVA